MEALIVIPEILSKEKSKISNATVRSLVFVPMGNVFTMPDGSILLPVFFYLSNTSEGKDKTNTMTAFKKW